MAIVYIEMGHKNQIIHVNKRCIQLHGSGLHRHIQVGRKRIDNHIDNVQQQVESIPDKMQDMTNALSKLSFGKKKKANIKLSF